MFNDNNDTPSAIKRRCSGPDMCYSYALYGELEKDNNKIMTHISPIPISKTVSVKAYKLQMMRRLVETFQKNLPLLVP